MNPFDIILKKRRGEVLGFKEMEYIVHGYNEGMIPDYQMAAFLMAAFIKGLDSSETSDLTRSIMNTGTVLNMDEIGDVIVDKHSTGGVGDKTSLVLAPLLCACGVKVAKISGRGLGHTGGTIDKLESFEGFKAELNIPEFIQTIKEIGMSIISQTNDLAPADKKIYSLRDVTATVDSIPFIASSIMSKKLAAGTDIIALDIKVGRGAFMKELKDAKDLANQMIKIGKSFNRKIIAIISDMNQPLGYAVGNSLEVKEAILALKGEGPSDLKELCLTIGSHILKSANKVNDLDEGRKLMISKLNNGSALKKFEQFLIKQGMKCTINDLPESENCVCLLSKQEGFVSWVDSEIIGRSSVLLGAGRKSKEDKIDRSVGIELLKKQGDYVKKGEVLVKLHYNYDSLLDDLDIIRENIKSSYEIVSKNKWENKEKIPLIYDIL